MFKVMAKIVMSSVFVSMIPIMFANVEASININSFAKKSFQFHGGVRQGCPLAPHQFLVVLDALYAAVKAVVHNNSPKEIILPSITA